MPEDSDNSDDELVPIKGLFPDTDEEQEGRQRQTATPPHDNAAAANAQQQLQQRHYLRCVNSTIVIRQLPLEGLSFQLWPAATSLVHLLDRHRSNPADSPLGPTLFALPNHRPLRILELGSGTGLVGIAAATILGADVTVTDLPHVTTNLQFNVDANARSFAHGGGTVAVAPLRWGEAHDAGLVGGEFDLVLASDVVYHDHLFDPLLKTLRLLFEGRGPEGDKKTRMFVMAHLRRWKKESAFFKKAKKMFDVDVIHVDSPCQGSRTGVVVYRFVWKHTAAEI